MKTKDSSIYLLIGVFILFAILAAVPYATGNMSGALTYAQRAGSICTDTDGGKDYYAAGMVEGLSDWCETPTILVEYYCSSYGNIASERYTCTGDYTCLNGACQIGADICYETDSGRAIFVKGTTTRAEESHTDYCYSDTAVMEYYCNPVNEIGTALSNCAYGCENGGCITRSASY